MFYAAASQFTNIIVDTTSGRIMIIPLLGPFLGPLLDHCRVSSYSLGHFRPKRGGHIVEI